MAAYHAGQLRHGHLGDRRRIAAFVGLLVTDRSPEAKKQIGVKADSTDGHIAFVRLALLP